MDYDGPKENTENESKNEDDDKEDPPEAAPLFFNHGSQVEYARHIRGTLVGDPDDVVYDQGDLRRYEEARGLWAPVDMQDVRKAVTILDEARVHKGTYKDGTPKIIRLAVNHMLMRDVSRVLCDLQAQPGRFANATPGLLFSNGFVSVDKGVLSVRPPKRDDNATHAVDFAFDRDAETPLFDAFLDDVMTGTDRAEKVRFVWEFIGVALLRAATRMQKAVFIVGGGANGKSTLIDIVQVLFPPGSVTSIAPQDFGSEYRLAFLRSALLNAVNESPDSEIAASATFKSTITGDLMMARQIREAPFAFRPIAAHVFLGNELPAFRDLSEGFARRWIVINMDREFSVEEQDRAIGPRIAKSESEAIVCRAIVAGADALRRGHFIEPTSSVAARRRWRVENDQVAVFVEERVQPVEEAKDGGSPMAIYRAYKAWATASGHFPVSSVKFGKRMKALGFPQRRSNGRRVYMCRLEELEE
jgi:putative DNA primase/helicase